MKRLLIPVAILFLCGCGDAENKKKALSPIGIDHSHTPAEAVEQGAPSTDKAWTPTDYVAFDAYLSKLPKNSYPRANSVHSKALFMKLVDSVEQPILAKTDIHLNGRMELALQMQQAANNTLKRYCWAHNSGTDYSTELVYLQGLALPITRQLLVLVDEFEPTIDFNDGKYEIRMPGLQKMKNGMATQLDGAILSLQETSIYSDAERRVLANYLVAEASAILDHLDTSVRREFEVKLHKLASSETNSDIRQMLAGLSDDTKKKSSNKADSGDGK